MVVQLRDVNELFEFVLSHFRVAHRHGDTAQCFCPIHRDKTASLTVTKKIDRIVVFCHAGCQTKDVLAAVGLTMKDLFLANKPQGSSWQRYVESREKRRIEETYDYVDCNGAYCYTKIRLQGKKLLYGILKNDRFQYGLQGRSRREIKALYFNPQAVKKAILDGKTIFIPEGEKDVNSLTKRGYVSLTYGGTNDWQPEFAAVLKGANVVILADNDLPGINVAKRIEADLKGVAKTAKIIIPTPDVSKGDISDYFASGRTNTDFEALIQRTVTENRIQTAQKITGLAVPEVKNLLNYRVDYDKDGNIKSKKVLQTVRNFEIAIENDSRFSGKIKFDEFSQQTFLVGNVPWELSGRNYRAWSSFDDSNLFSILQSDYDLNNRNDFFDALKNIAIRNKFHPVRNILDSFKWDGKNHIRKLLPDYLGVEDTEYTYQVMRLWMLGAVTRIYQPGAKFDYTVIFKGRQGLGKSTFLQLLALDSGWFNDSLDSLDSDKSAQSLMGSWIIELAELKSLARTAGGVDSVKRFLTATQDKLRLPYERRADIFLRQCVFAGTTNRDDFLSDETGNRRFLVIEAGVNEPTKSLFVPEAMEDIKAAWAEAVHIYETDKPPLLLPDSCKKQAAQLQTESMADDGKTGIIEEFLRDKQRTCAIEVWREALNEVGRPAKWQASEINTIIVSLPEWERMTSPGRFGEYGMQRGFQRCKHSDVYKDVTNKPYEPDFQQLTKEEQLQIPFH